MISDASSRQGPISPGNVVSAALRIYRDQFKVFFGLALKACLWALVPLYGWGKYGVHTATISRMAHQTLINQPETPRQSYKQLNPKLWSFLGVGFLAILAIGTAYVILAIAGSIVGGLIVFVLSAILSAALGDAGTFIATIIGILVGVCIWLIGFIQVLSRLFIAEIPLAMEANTKASDSLSRSWNLTKSSVGRVQLVVLATYIVTIPLFMIGGWLPQLLLIRLDPTAPITQTLSLLLFFVSLAINIAVIPFWQAAKGILYYDLRSRREGADLKI